MILAFDGSSWLDRDQMAFHFPLFVVFTLLFIPRLSVFIVGILAVLSYIVAHNGWIDENIYHFIVASGSSFFPPEAGIVNPQYVKLVLFCIGLMALSPLVIIKKYRSEDRLFGFFGALACLGVTFLIHKSIPGQTLSWERSLIQNNMKRLMAVASTPERLEDFCRSFSLKCFSGIDEGRISEVSADSEAQRLIKDRLDRMTVSGEDVIVFEHGYFDDGEWRRQVFSVRSDSPKKWTIAIEEEQINMSQKTNEESFGRLAFSAHLVWGWLFLFVGMAHRSTWKSRVFGSG